MMGDDYDTELKYSLIMSDLNTFQQHIPSFIQEI